jgi:hypothetical protein
MKSIIVALGLTVLASSADAGTVRTASWFADHPAQRKLVLGYCQDDPGEASRQPNCANAFQGEIIAAEIDARRHVGANVSPTVPGYWTRPENAEQLRFWALQCARAKGASAEVRRSMNCDAIAQAGG